MVVSKKNITFLRSGIPIMDIYAALGNRYDLSEERIRKIVAQEAKG